MSESSSRYTNTRCEHWQVVHDADNIVWLSCDRAGETSNSLSEAVLTELGSILDDIAALPLAGAVVQSAKPDSFIRWVFQRSSWASFQGWVEPYVAPRR